MDKLLHDRKRNSLTGYFATEIREQNFSQKPSNSTDMAGIILQNWTPQITPLSFHTVSTLTTGCQKCLDTSHANTASLVKLQRLKISMLIPASSIWRYLGLTQKFTTLEITILRNLCQVCQATSQCCFYLC